MDKSREQFPDGKHSLTQDQIQELDFRRHAPPLHRPPDASPPKKLIHAYTLHARSAGRFKDAIAPVVNDPHKTL